MNSHHAPEHGGAPIIDAETMESLAALAGDADPHLVEELITLFLDDAAERMAGMRAAHESGQVDSVARTAHALKSASASVGVLAFSERCRDIEHAARDGESSDECIAIALAMFEEVRVALEQFRSSL